MHQLQTSKQRPTGSDQRGIGTIGMVGILIGLGAVFLMIFLFTSGGTGPSTTNKQPSSTEQPADSTLQAVNKEPPFIRIPDNSLIYKNSTYKFSFAYPSSFEKLTEKPSTNASATGSVFQVNSAEAVSKPVGTTGAVLSGTFGAYIYKKQDFKILVGNPEVFVSAAKTGDDTTWKVVSRGNTNQDISIGDSFPVKTIRSQTGIPVFDFTLKVDNKQIGRYVFELDNHYVLIALPTVSLPSGQPLSNADIAAYTVIGSNLASTTRAQLTAASDSDAGNGASTESVQSAGGGPDNN